MGSPGPGMLSPPLTVAPVFFQSIIFDEVDLTDASVAESSTKNVNNSFTVSLDPHLSRFLCNLWFSCLI